MFEKCYILYTMMNSRDKQNYSIFIFSVLPHKNKCFWYEMAKSMWVICNSLHRPFSLQPICIHQHWGLKVYQLYEFAIYTTWKIDNERWHGLTELITWLNHWSIYWWTFSDLKPNSYDINNMKSNLHVSTKWQYCLWLGSLVWKQEQLQLSPRRFAMHF